MARPVHVNYYTMARKEKDSDEASEKFKAKLAEKLDGSKQKAIVLGPAKCPLYRLRGMYRRQILLKTQRIMDINQILAGWLRTERNFGLPARIKIIVDIDPFDMM